MKRIISVLLCLVSLLMFVGCGGGKDPDEELKVDVAPLRETNVKIAFRGDRPDDVDNVVKAVNKKLAQDGKPYTVEFLFIGEMNYITELENKSKEEGLDAAWIYVDDYANLIARKTIRSIDEYLDAYGPNVKSRSAAYTWESLRRPDGKVYAIPRNAPLAAFEQMIQVRKDWMTALGMEKIETLEDMNEYFSGITSDDRMGGGKPNFYADAGDHCNRFLLREYANDYHFVMPFWTLSVDLTKRNADGTYKVENFIKSQAYINWATKVEEYKTAGFMPEGGSPAVQGPESRFYAGMLGSAFSFPLKMAERVDAFMLNVAEPKDGMPKPELYDVMLHPEKPRYVTVGAENLMTVMSYSKNPNETIDFFNWMFDKQENYDLVAYGVKDVNYFGWEKEVTYNGETRTIPYISFVKGSGADKKIIAPNKRYSILMPNWAFTDLRFIRWSENLSDEYIFSRLNWEVNDEQGNPVNYKVSPLVGFSPDMSVPVLKDIWPRIQALSSMYTGFFTGTQNISEGDNYKNVLAELDKAGIDLVIEEVQKQLDAYVKEKGI